MANLVPLLNSSLIKPKKSAIVKTDKFLIPKIKPTSAIVKFAGRTSETLGSGGALVEVEKKIVQIDKLLKDSLMLSKKEGEKKRVSEEQKEFEKREKELEKNKPKPIPGIKLPSLPKMGFLDWIKNFVTQTILGFFAVRLIEHLPKLLALLPTIIKVSDFVVGLGGKLLDGLISFVDFGYKAYDATRGFIKNLGGEGLAKNFDKFAGALNTMLDVAILAAISAATMGDEFGRDVVKDTTKDVARKGARGVFGRGGARAGTRLGLKFIGKDATKQVLRFIKPIAGRAPLIGGLLEFGISWALGDPIGKAAFRGVGSLLLGAIGTAIGGPVGLAVGSLAGGELGGVLYDMFFGGKKPSNKVAKAAGGGIPATRGGKLVAGPSKRTLKKKKKPRTLSFTPRKIKPGANTGGEAKVQQVFPNPEKPQGFLGWLGGLFGGRNQQQQQQKPQKPKEKTANPQEFLVGSNDVLGRAKFFGPFATIVLKSVLGQQPDDLDYKNAGKGLNAWVQTTFGGGTLGFAGGGEVDARQYFGGEDYTDVISKTIKESVTKEVDTTIRNLSKELALRPVGRDEMIQENIKQQVEPSLDVGPGGIVTGGNADFWSLAAIASLESGNPQGQADVAQVIYNRLASGKYAGKTIKQLIIAPNQFSPVGESNPRLWGAISDKQSAINAVASHRRGGTRAAKMVEEAAANIRNAALQKSSAEFVGGRTDFAVPSAAQKYPGGFGYVERYGHLFGWYVGPGSIAYGKTNPGPAKAPSLGNIVVMGGGAIGQQKGNLDTAKKLAQSMGLQLTSAQRGPRYPGDRSLHISGRAMDFSNDSVGRGTPQQLEFAKKMVSTYGSSLSELIYTPLGYGIAGGKKVGLDHWGPGTNSEHYNHVHVAFEKGGRVGGLTRAILGEKGPEFVIDADSTRALEDNFPGFLDALNRAKYNDAINVLMNYTEDDRPIEMVFVEVPSQPEVIPVPMGSGGGVYVGGGIDNKVPGMDVLNAIG